MIELHNVTKTYGEKVATFVALDDISLRIESGAVVAIVGKSGSGKSTLMHIMSGLDRPTRGTITIDDVDVSAMKARQMDIFRATKMSFIFQSFFVEANQTCYQNVMLPLEIANIPQADRRAMVMNALSAVELGDKANNTANTLSGGQKQRLAIARAIVTKPSILFADEPTGNLDSATGDKITSLLFDLNKRLGCTILIVTHDHELANRCQKQIRISDGRIQP